LDVTKDDPLALGTIDEDKDADGDGHHDDVQLED